MIYYCSNCGMFIKEKDVAEEEYCIGEAWGRPIYDTVELCPKCSEPVEEYDGEPDTDEVYENPFLDFAESFGRRDDDD